MVAYERSSEVTNHSLFLFYMQMESANPTISVPWSGLPPELLAHISKRLRTKIDHRRFRAVCRSWRSSTPPYKFPTIKLPFPFDPNPDPKHSGAYFTLTERIVYRIQLPDSKDPDFWLVKVEFDDHGKAKILNPVTHRKIQIPPEFEAPKMFNILDFDVTEVCSAYALRYVNPSTPDEIDDYYDYRHASKVVYSANEENGEYVVTAIDRKSRLWHINSGGEKWNLTQRESYAIPFYDVAIVKGKLHAYDWFGAGMWAYDSEFEFVTTGNPPLFALTFAMKNRLVELYSGELVLVEEMPKCSSVPPDQSEFHVKEPVVQVRVHVLSQQSKTWVDAKALNGCIIVVGDDCSFSVPATQQGVRVFYMDRYVFIPDADLDSYTGFECDCREICNCLGEEETLVVADLIHSYASDDVRHIFEGFYGNNVGVYDYESGNSGTALMFPEYASIFWPPPAWLSRG